MSAVLSQVLWISIALLFFLSFILSPVGAAVVASLLLLQGLFVGGLLGFFAVPFDVVTLIVSSNHPTQQLASHTASQLAS